MQQQRPSLPFIALLVLLLSLGLGALIVLSVRGTRPSDPPPTAAPVVTVLPTGGTAAGTSASPSPSATAPAEAILATPSRTPVPPLIVVDTPTRTPRATETPTPDRTPVQKGEVPRG